MEEGARTTKQVSFCLFVFGSEILTDGLFHHGRPSKSPSWSHFGGPLISPEPCSDASSSRLDESKGDSSPWVCLPDAPLTLSCPLFFERREERDSKRSRPFNSASAWKTSSFSMAKGIGSSQEMAACYSARREMSWSFGDFFF